MTLKLISLLFPDSHSWPRRLLTSHISCCGRCYGNKGHTFNCVSHTLCSVCLSDCLSTTALITATKLAENSPCLSQMLGRSSSGPIRRHVRPDFSMEMCWTVPPLAVTCQSSSRVSQLSESAALSLPVSVRPKSTRRHNTREAATLEEFSGGVRCMNCQQFHYFTAPLLCLSLSLQGGSAPLWVYSLHPPTRSHSRYGRHCYPNDAFGLPHCLPANVWKTFAHVCVSSDMTRPFTRDRNVGLHYDCFLFH